MTDSTKKTRIPSLDIDDYLNPFIPRPRWSLLPRVVSHWFGYRPSDTSWPLVKEPRKQQLLGWLFAFLGGFIGIAIIENVFRNLPLLGGHQAPLVIASFGAAAILEYNAIESPLSQPRNLVLGHMFSAAIGVGITKLFRLLPPERFEDLRWIAGALAVGCASTVMSITKTVHPPAGATALLAATTQEITELGWWVLALVILACMLMLVSAMLVNNLYKRFPLHWWTPVDLGKLRVDKKRKKDVVTVSDMEKGKSDDGRSSIETDGSKEKQQQRENASPAKVEEAGTLDSARKHNQAELEIRVEAERIVVPDWMQLSEFEVSVLEGVQERLQAKVKSDN